MISIIDYGMGNLRSVLNAFEALGAPARIASRPEDLAGADGIVLPGVGAFGDGIANLRRAGFVDELERQVRAGGRPFLGICLGMHLLAETGLEHGTHRGLGWIAGEARPIPLSDDGSKLRLPHIGWNEVRILKADGLFSGQKDGLSFYFVHGYVLSPRDPGVVSASCRYGSEFAAAVEDGNICAVQFHPEKSHHPGMALLKNWCARLPCSRSA